MGFPGRKSLSIKFMEKTLLVINRFDYSSIETPSFVVFESLLENNLQTLNKVIEQTNCKILLALKCFSMSASFGRLAKTLHGVCASGPHEARLGFEEFKKEVHVYSPGFSVKDVEESAKLCDHLTFNSFGQYKSLGSRARALNPKIKMGIRCNPEHSETALPIYDPCAPGSRLGVTLSDFIDQDLTGITGLHMHTLCEKGADAFARTLKVFEAKFGKWLKGMEWVNFGGGHHITSAKYNVQELIETLQGFKARYPHLQIY